MPQQQVSPVHLIEDDSRSGAPLPPVGNGVPPANGVVHDVSPADSGGLPRQSPAVASQDPSKDVGVQDVSYVSHNPKIPRARRPANATCITIDDLRQTQHNINHMTTSLREMPFEKVLQKLYLPGESLDSDSGNTAPRVKMLSTKSGEGIL